MVTTLISAVGRNGLRLRAVARVIGLSAALAAVALGAPDDPPGAADSSLQTFHAANGLLQRGLHELAEAEYRKFLGGAADTPQAAVARYGLAVCLQRRGQIEESLRELAAIGTAPEFEFAAEALLLKGQCYARLKQFDEAEAALAALQEAHASHELADDAAALQIEVRHRGGKPRAAQELATAFGKRFSESPLTPRVALLAALAEIDLGEFSAAAGRLTALVERKDELARHAQYLLARCHDSLNDLPAAQKGYERVLEDGTSRFARDALLGLASVKHRQKDLPAAATLLDRLLLEQPDAPQRGQALLLRGLVAFDAGAWAEAEKHLSQAAKRADAPQDQIAYWLAKCALRGERFTEAAEQLERALEKHLESAFVAEMRFDRAVALSQSGRLPAAIAALEQFLSKHKRHALAPAALHLQANLAHRQGEFSRSRELCNAFLRAYASHPLAAAVCFLSAENAFLAGEDETAIAGFEEFLNAHAQHEYAPRARYRLGMAQLRAGRSDEALAALQGIVDQAATDAALRPALLALGELHLRRGELSEAERRLTQFIEASPPGTAAADALLQRGLARLRQQRAAEALQDFDRLLKDFPDSGSAAHALFERGQALLALKQPEPARAALESVIERDGRGRFGQAARLQLGALALQADNAEAAIQHFEAILDGAAADDAARGDARFQLGVAQLAAGQHEAAHKSLQRYLKEHADGPSAEPARAYAAIALARQERHTEALAALERLRPELLAALAPALRTRVTLEKAACLRKLDRASEAALLYRLVADDANADDAARTAAGVNLAELDAAEGGCERAIERLTALHDAASRAQRAWDDARVRTVYRLAVCEFERGGFERAAALLETLLREQPQHALAGSAAAFCGEAQLRLGRHGQAAEQLARVVERHPSDAAYPTSLLRLGEALAGLEQWERSEQTFSRYLKEFADSEHAHQAQFGVGWAREQRGLLDAAIEAYRGVTERHRGVTAARAQFQIGECLFGEKRFEEAVRELLKVDILYAYPEWSAAALFEAGRCFLELGKLAEAREQFNAVIENHPQSRWAEQARRSLSATTAGASPGRSNGKGS